MCSRLFKLYTIECECCTCSEVDCVKYVEKLLKTEHWKNLYLENGNLYDECVFDTIIIIIKC